VPYAGVRRPHHLEIHPLQPVKLELGPDVAGLGEDELKLLRARAAVLENLTAPAQVAAEPD
jgi:hypothetical protein